MCLFIVTALNEAVLAAVRPGLHQSCVKIASPSLGLPSDFFLPLFIDKRLLIDENISTFIP